MPPVQGAGAAVLKCALGTLWEDLKGSDEAKLCGAVHDELLVLVREGFEDKWIGLVRYAMESAEAKWLGDIPAIADVNCGQELGGSSLVVNRYTSAARR